MFRRLFERLHRKPRPIRKHGRQPLYIEQLEDRVLLSADIHLTESAPQVVAPGTNLTANFTLANNGPDNAQNVVLNVYLPSGTTFSSQAQTGGPAFTLAQNGGMLSDTISTLPAGTSANFSIVVSVPATTPLNSSLSGGGFVQTSTQVSSSSVTTAGAMTTVQAQADLQVTQSAPATVPVMSNLVSTITVTNNGPATAQNVTLADVLPVGTTLVSQSQTAGPAFTLNGSGSQVNDTIATLASGASATFTVTALVGATIPAGTVLSGTATVGSMTSDPSTSNNSATATTTVTPMADLAVLNPAPNAAFAGGDITYSLTVTNNGPSDAQNVAIADTLPAGTTFVSQSQTGGAAFTLGHSGNQIANTIATLPAGASATFSVIALVGGSVADAAALADTVTVSSSTPDPNPGNNTATASTPVTALADLSTDVTGPGEVLAGGEITYHITVSNAGPGDAQNVALSDPLPAGMAFVSQSQMAGTAFTLANTGNQVSDTIASLPAGASATFLVTARLNAGVANETILSYTATASSSTTDPYTINNSATVHTTAFTYTSGTTTSVTVTNPGPQFDAEGDAVSLRIQASDSASGTLNYSAGGLPDGLTIDPNSGLISGTISGGAAANGPFAVTVTVTDGSASGSQTFWWYVTAAGSAGPIVVTNPGQQSGTEGDTVSLQIHAVDTAGGTLSYSAAGLPPGLAINASSGLISGTIAAAVAAGGPYHATVTVSDGTNSDPESFIWLVTAPGSQAQLIIVINPGNQTNAVGNQVSLQVDVSDLAGGTPTYGATGLPTGLGINANTGLISGTVTAAGTYQVTATATDGSSQDQETLTWTVNAPVVVTNPGDQVGTEGDQVSLQIQASDATGGTLTYSATGLPLGLRIDPNSGLVSGTISPGAATASPYQETITATDGNVSGQQSLSWAVSSAVTLGPVDDQKNAGGDQIALQVVADDARGAALSYSATGLPPGLTIDPDTGLISGTVAAGAAAGGPYHPTVSATDGTYSNTTSFIWGVTGSVVVTNLGDQSNVEGDAISLQVQASDATGGTLTYSATGLPPGLTIDPNSGLISGTIAAGASASGPFAATVTATDGIDRDSQSFQWSVGAPLSDPSGPVTITNLGDRANAEGDAVSLQVQAADSAGRPLTYSAGGLPAGLSIDPNTGLITGTISAGAAQGWPYQTTVTAADGDAIESQSFAWRITGPVVVITLAGQSTAAGDQITLQVHASDATGGTLAYAATGLPAGLSINPTTGLISGTLGADAVDSLPYQVTVTASDGTEGDYQTFTWSVISPVSVTNPGNQSNAEGGSVGLQIHAADSRGGTLSYSVIGLPPGLGINTTTGLISGTIIPGASANGPYEVTVTATDGTYSSQQSFAWAVSLPSSVPGPVTVVNLGILLNFEGDQVSLHVPAADTSGGTLTFSATGLPPGLTIDHSSGAISGTVSAGAAISGPYLVTVTASDGANYDSQSFSWDVVGPVTLTSPGDQSTAEGDQVNVQVQATDSAGAALTYSAIGLPAGLSINPSTGLISGTISPGAALSGPYQVTVRASDGTSGDSASLSWDVTCPVSVSNPGDQNGTEGDQVTLQVQATDSTGTTLSYSVAGLPPGLTIDPGSGLISGVIRTGAAAGGPYQVTVTVTDGTSGVKQSFSWAVSLPGPVRITAPGNQTSAAGDSVELPLQATDSAGGTLSYSATGLPAGLTIDSLTGLISGTISAGTAAGSFSVTLTASDGNYADSQSFSWTVTAPGVVTITSPGDQSSNVGDSIGLLVSAADTSGGTVTFSATGLAPGLSINATTGLISGTPSGGATTTPYLVTITATDGSNSDKQSFQWTVTAAGSVTVTSPGNQSRAEGDSVELQVRAVDSSGGALSYSAVGLPAGLQIDPTTGLISGKISSGAAANGPYSVTVSASDGPSSDSQTFQWTVTAAGAITIDSPGDQLSAEGDPITLPIVAHDSNNGTLTYSVTGLPAGLSIDANSGVITGTVGTGTASGGPYLVTVTVTDGTSTDKLGFRWTVGAPNPGAAGPLTGDSPEGAYGSGVNPGPGVLSADDLLNNPAQPAGAPAVPTVPPPSSSGSSGAAGQPSTQITSGSYTRHYTETANSPEGDYYLDVVITASQVTGGTNGSPPTLTGTTTTTTVADFDGMTFSDTQSTPFSIPLPFAGGLPYFGFTPAGGILGGSIFADEGPGTAGWDHVHWTDAVSFNDAGSFTVTGATYQFANSAANTAWRDTTHSGGPDGDPNWTGTETWASTFGDTYRYDATVTDKAANLPANTQLGSDGYPTNFFNDPVNGTAYLAHSFQSGNDGGNAKDTYYWTDGQVTKVITGQHTKSNGQDAYRIFFIRTEQVKADPNNPDSLNSDTLTYKVDYQRQGGYGSSYDADMAGPTPLSLGGTVTTDQNNNGTVLRDRFSVTDVYHQDDGTLVSDGTATLAITDNGVAASYYNDAKHTYTTLLAGLPGTGLTLSPLTADTWTYENDTHGSTKVTTTDDGTFTLRLKDSKGAPAGLSTGTVYSSTKDTLRIDMDEWRQVDAVARTSTSDIDDQMSGTSWSLRRTTSHMTTPSNNERGDVSAFSLAWGNFSSTLVVQASIDGTGRLPAAGWILAHSESTQGRIGRDWWQDQAPDAAKQTSLTLRMSNVSSNQTTLLSTDEYGLPNGFITRASSASSIIDTTTTLNGSFKLTDKTGTAVGSGTANDRAHVTVTSSNSGTVDLDISEGLASGKVNTKAANTTKYDYELHDTSKKDDGQLTTKTDASAGGSVGGTSTINGTLSAGKLSGSQTFVLTQKGNGSNSTIASGDLKDGDGHKGHWELNSTTRSDLDDTVTIQSTWDGYGWKETGRTFDNTEDTYVNQPANGKPGGYVPTTFTETDDGLGRGRIYPIWKQANTHGVRITDSHSSQQTKKGSPENYHFHNTIVENMSNRSYNIGSFVQGDIKESFSNNSSWTRVGKDDREGDNKNGDASETIHEDVTQTQGYGRGLTIVTDQTKTQTLRRHNVVVHTKIDGNTNSAKGTRTTTTTDLSWEKTFNPQTNELLSHSGDLEWIVLDQGGGYWAETPHEVTHTDDIGWGKGITDKPLPGLLDTLWQDFTNDDGVKAIGDKAGGALRIAGGTVDVVLGIAIILGSSGLGVVPGVGLIAIGLDQIVTGATNLATGQQSMSVFEFGGYSGAKALGTTDGQAQTIGQWTPAVLSMAFGAWGAAEVASLRGAQTACFAAGTPLLIPEGSKVIEQLRPGDFVLARDENDPTGPLEPKVIEEVFVATGLILHIHVGGQVIRTTPEHPLYVRQRGWTPSWDLRAGDLLATADGRWIAVEDVLDTGEYETVYNLRVQNHHTYFVGSEEWGFSVWAHNACTVEQARAVALGHGGVEIGEGRFLFPTRRAARQAASEIAGDLGADARRISQQEFDGLPGRLGGSNRTIGRQSANGSVGWRDDWFGHPFDGRPHVNVWGNGVDFHLYYEMGGWPGLGFGRPWG